MFRKIVPMDRGSRQGQDWKSFRAETFTGSSVHMSPKVLRRFVLFLNFNTI